MSQFIFGKIVENEPKWMQSHINTLDRPACRAARSYQDAISLGYFPPQNEDYWVTGGSKPFHHWQARAFSFKVFLAPSP